MDESFNCAEVRIIFDDPRELEYTLALNLMRRRINRIEVTQYGTTRIYVPQRQKEEDYGWMSD